MDAVWQELGTLERSNTYTILLRDGTCKGGKIQKIEPDKLTFESGNTVVRSDVLYVGEGISPHEILYSGRSSWHDVKEVKPGSSENLEIRLKSGKSMRGSVISASDSDLTIKRFGRAIKILKHDIAQVNYIRFKPVSESHWYIAQEAPELEFLDPKWWQYLLRIGALQSVRIYDSAIPEDNSPTELQQPYLPELTPSREGRDWLIRSFRDCERMTGHTYITGQVMDGSPTNRARSLNAPNTSPASAFLGQVEVTTARAIPNVEC